MRDEKHLNLTGTTTINQLLRSKKGKQMDQLAADENKILWDESSAVPDLATYTKVSNLAFVKYISVVFETLQVNMEVNIK